MKMRKYFVMALVALGATAAFSSCQKDEKTFKNPVVTFRDGNDKTITEFTKESFEGKRGGIVIMVELGDKSLKLDKLEVKVLAKTKDEVNGKVSVSPKRVQGGADDGKYEAVVKFDETKIKEDLEKLRIEATAIDSKGKSSTGTLMWKAKGGETPTGTPMKNENTAAYVNHAFGEGTGAYSFSGKKAVTALDAGGTEREIINLSETGKPFVLKFGSKAEFKFVKLNSGDVDYATATVEKVGALIKGKGTTAEIELKEGDLFIAVAKDGITFYLAKVTKVSTDGYYDGAEKAAASTAKGKGYILFSYKSNK